MTLKHAHLKNELNMKSANSNNEYEDLSKLGNTLISIIIPMYNEENSIKNVLKRLPNHQYYEILIIDDGSTDDSLRKVMTISNREIKIIKHEKNRGYGAAILTGFKEAKGNIIITMDSDGQHNPEEIPKLILPIINKQADIVVGSRYLGNCDYRIPSYTRVGEFFINLILRLFYNQNVGNNQSGFRAFKKETLRIFDNLIFNNFGLCTEILFKAAYHGYKIIEVPVIINQREYGSSYVNLIKLAISISTCVLISVLEKFKLLRFIPKLIALKLKKRLIC